MFLVQLPVSKELYDIKNDENAPLEMHSINNKKYYNYSVLPTNVEQSTLI